MISADDFHQLFSEMEVTENTFCRRLNITHNKFSQFLSEGILDPLIEGRFRLFRHNYYARKEYTFEDLEGLQGRLGLRDIDMQLLFDIRPEKWKYMRQRRSQPVDPQVRKLAGILSWMEEEGINYERYIGFS